MSKRKGKLMEYDVASIAGVVGVLYAEKEIEPMDIVKVHFSHVCDDYWFFGRDGKTKVFFSPSHPQNLRPNQIRNLLACRIPDTCLLVSRSDVRNEDGIAVDGYPDYEYENRGQEIRRVVARTFKNYLVYMNESLSQMQSYIEKYGA